MLKNQNTKRIFYELNPLFFYDNNGDGFGDFEGVSKKMKYFSFIGIDCVIIPDIFNNYNTLLFNSFVNLKNKYGSMTELKNMISNFQSKNIDFAVEINIKDIKKSLLFSVDGTINQDEFKESTKAFFLDKNQSENQSENWNSRATLEAFSKIIKFWLSYDVTNFVFVNFEKLFNKNEIFSNVTEEQLQQLYKITKDIDPSISVIIKSASLSPINIKNILDPNNRSGDLFIDTSYSLIGTHPKYLNDKIEKFKPSKLFKKIKQSSKGDILKENVVMSLGSSLTGRINSRWGNEISSNSLASKALMSISLASSSSSLIYYGDELGMLKINIKNNSDFNDIYAIERRRLMQSQGQKQKDFYYAQQYLSPINTQSLFQWDKTKNGGFSTSDITIRQLSSTYKEINVANQYHNPDSSLVYLKKFIEFIKNPIYKHFFNSSKTETKIKYMSKGIIKYTHVFGEEKLFIFINVSENWKKVNISDKLAVVLSNYSKKSYNHKINMLSPFESIILFSKKDYIQ